MGIEVVIKTQAVNIYINISVPLSVGKFVVQCVDWPDSLSVHQVNVHPGRGWVSEPYATYAYKHVDFDLDCTTL